MQQLLVGQQFVCDELINSLHLYFQEESLFIHFFAQQS